MNIAARQVASTFTPDTHGYSGLQINDHEEETIYHPSNHYDHWLYRTCLRYGVPATNLSVLLSSGDLRGHRSSNRHKQGDSTT